MGPDFGPPPIFSIMMTVIPLIVIGGIAFIIIKGVGTWMSNNASPVLTKAATVVAKRTRVSGGGGETSASTRYYLTFELADGERVELPVNGRVYGQLIEGDRGTLTYQGTRYQGFERMTNTR